MAVVKPAAVAGRFVPEPLAEAIHAYLLTQRCGDVYDLVAALRLTKLMREPK